ncbi:hypothetical protein [Nocardia aurantia]|uniref:Tetratricopeptide repeat protein n=1 Tax=Nocardia aurantia TaxID=2585199 RepID=A0A7K0DUP9_9NOCA|nr:hypothetical protein [Nocardia aurantia]MQY29485.1 hypothetical protein [Nocardia aurantia]
MDHASVERALAALAVSGSRKLDSDCDRLARGYVAEGVEPQFTVPSADFATDPYLICADRYWNLRFRDSPSLYTAVDCAGWLTEHVAADHAEAVREKWAMGYAFITRDTVDSAGEIADATADIIAADRTGERAYFATLYHAGKLRADYAFDELAQFLESSPLSVSISHSYWDKPLFVALRALAAFGSRRITAEHARSLFETAWQAPGRTREAVDVALNGVAISVEFAGRGELLRTHAAEAVALYPDDHIFAYRLAIGQRLCGDYDAALDSIGAALRKLPRVGWRVSYDLLQQQYRLEEQMITYERISARHADEMRTAAAQHGREVAALTERYRAELRELADSTQRNQYRSIEMVALFAAMIAFAVGSLNVTLSGALSLPGRVGLIAELGGGLLLFSVTILAGVWWITRRR